MNEDYVMVKGCVVGKVKRVLTLRKVRLLIHDPEFRLPIRFEVDGYLSESIMPIYMERIHNVHARTPAGAWSY